jgi:hypothetical protein
MYIYSLIMCFSTFVLYGDVGVIRVCVFGANGRTCVFWVKWDISNFLSFHINV